MRVEPAASSFPARAPTADPAGVPTGPAHGKFDLAGEGQLARIRARSDPSGTARPDADIVAVVLCHDRTIGIRFMLAKSLQGPVVLWRNNTWRSVETAEPASPHRAAAIRLNVESKSKNASDAIPRTFRSATLAPPHTAKTNVQTTTYAQRAGGSQIRFILPFPFPFLRPVSERTVLEA
jgi:hypothetical protein